MKVRIEAKLSNDPSWACIAKSITLAAEKLGWECRTSTTPARKSLAFYYDHQHELMETQSDPGWTDEAFSYQLMKLTDSSSHSEVTATFISITLPCIGHEHDEFRYQKRSKIILHATISVDDVDDDYEPQHSEQLEALKAFVSMFIESANYFGTKARMKEIMANGDPDGILKCPIDRLGLSPVIETMLEAGQIETAGMLIEHSIKTLMEKFPGLGNDGVREIQDTIANHGLLLKTDNGPI